MGAITKEMQENLREVFSRDRLFIDGYNFEIQDDSEFILMTVNADRMGDDEMELASKFAVDVFSSHIPSRTDEYSWMVNFKKNGKVVDSYFGGNEASPKSGLKN